MPERIGWMECSVLGGNGKALSVEFYSRLKNGSLSAFENGFVQEKNCKVKNGFPAPTRLCLASCSHEGNLILANVLIFESS